LEAASTIPSFLRALHEQFGERDAVVLGSERLTYRQLDEDSRALARALLARGLQKGARVGLWLGNGPSWVVTWAAIARAGGVAVPISTFARGAEMRRVIAHADLAGLITQRTHLGHDRLRQLAEALPELERGDSALALVGAPFLRWVVCIDGDHDRPHWAHRCDWLADCGVLDDAMLDAVEAQIVPSDLATMIYTSGTTSDPKGVLHTHETIVVKARYLRDQLSFADGERCFTLLPFFWVGGLTMSLLPVLAAGGTQVCMDEFDAAGVLEVLERERVSRAGFFPDKVDALRAHRDFAMRDLSALRVGNPELLATPGPDVGRARNGLSMGLGMTETFGCYSWGRFDDGNPNIRDVNGGRRTPPLEELQPGVDLRVVDREGGPVPDGATGEIQVRGACVTTGLHKLPRADAFTEDGFLRTGDCGEPRDGAVVFRGRLKEMIKTAGANVAPAEVVVALLALDGVAAAHVVGLPDPVRGEVVAAAVVAEDGVQLDPDVMRGELKAQMSTFKVPRYIVQFRRDELPWNEDSDKIRSGELVDALQRRLVFEGGDHD
jgi:acyl-CoA synthetase (AMP-forming)/AMP-acid ligase II